MCEMRNMKNRLYTFCFLSIFMHFGYVYNLLIAGYTLCPNDYEKGAKTRKKCEMRITYGTSFAIFASFSWKSFSQLFAFCHWSLNWAVFW